MIRVRFVTALATFSIPALLLVGCHRRTASGNDRVIVADTVVKESVEKTVITETFKDTVRVVSPPRARGFDLRSAAGRDSLRAVLKREHALWEARRPRDYRYLLRVSCFCPGQQGWLAIEVRNNRVSRALATNGKAVELTDWNTLSVDQLFDNLERSIDRYRAVEVSFDPRWHFPAAIRTTAIVGPDSWGIMEARTLKPM